MSITTSRTQPALIGGLVMGVLSALPLVSAGNICCCLWVIAGGVVAAYLLQQNEPLPITSGDGAQIGLLAGVIGAFIYLVLSIPIAFVVEPFQRAFVERISQTEDLPPEFREYVRSFVGGRTAIVLGFMSYLFAGVIFSTLGGVIGAAIFRKPPPPPSAVPGVIEAPPPTYP